MNGIMDLRTCPLCGELAYQTSSELWTISKVGVLGTIFFIRFLSSFVTKEGVTGMQGVKG